MRPTLELFLAALLLVACGSAATPVPAAPAAPAASPAASPADGAGAAPTPVPADVHPALAAAVTGDPRTAENRARDRYRHPAETLDFFGIRPDMRVVEIWPGRGWYTEILAPLLRAEGKLVCAITDPEADGYRGELGQHFLSWKAEDPALLGEVETVIFNPPDHASLGEPGTADMVVTFRNTHNWVLDGQAEPVFGAIFEVLRPGGVLGLVQHRERPGAEPITDERRGYLPEDYVVGLAREAGFVLEERSEVNANPNDTKDYPEQVWSLPPVLREGETNRERYLAIGESDRMTLRFRKPEAE